jgi:quercetin dioxygenase-like cupin family protein
MGNSRNLISLPTDGKSLSLGGLGVIYKVMPEDTAGALAVVEHPIEPGRLVRPHTHSNEDEISYVVEGEIGVRIGDKELSAGPGTWVFKPRGVPYTFWNAGPKQARLIEIITPGAFAHYFEELAAILGSGGPPDLGRLAILHQKYGQTYSEEWIPSLKARYGLKLVGD